MSSYYSFVPAAKCETGSWSLHLTRCWLCLAAHFSSQGHPSTTFQTVAEQKSLLSHFYAAFVPAELCLHRHRTCPISDLALRQHDAFSDYKTFAEAVMRPVGDWNLPTRHMQGTVSLKWVSSKTCITVMHEHLLLPYMHQENAGQVDWTAGSVIFHSSVNLPPDC